jgi:Ni/Co efflux regulator RcnB
MIMRKIAGLLFLSLAASLALPAAAATVPSFDQTGLRQIQYDRDRDRRDDDRDFRPDRKWRPGEVLPGRFLNRVVRDWEERGLSRPPNDHQWVRVGYQFILVRGRDRMIARILNFD